MTYQFKALVMLVNAVTLTFQNIVQRGAGASQKAAEGRILASNLNYLSAQANNYKYKFNNCNLFEIKNLEINSTW